LKYSTTRTGGFGRDAAGDRDGDRVAPERVERRRDAERLGDVVAGPEAVVEETSPVPTLSSART
jgi:hypothetical protein